MIVAPLETTELYAPKGRSRAACRRWLEASETGSAGHISELCLANHCVLHALARLLALDFIKRNGRGRPTRACGLRQQPASAVAHPQAARLHVRRLSPQ